MAALRRWHLQISNLAHLFIAPGGAAFIFSDDHSDGDDDAFFKVLTECWSESLVIAWFSPRNLVLQAGNSPIRSHGS